MKERNGLCKTTNTLLAKHNKEQMTTRHMNPYSGGWGVLETIIYEQLQGSGSMVSEIERAAANDLLQEYSHVIIEKLLETLEQRCKEARQVLHEKHNVFVQRLRAPPPTPEPEAPASGLYSGHQPRQAFIEMLMNQHQKKTD